VLTIGQLCRRFGLSRSTLLYYDRIGLLHPTGRSASNYRLYSDADVQRMERIIVFRQAGIALAEIGRILDAGAEGPRRSLESRLASINSEISALRQQQGLISRLLQDPSVLARAGALDKQGWVDILRASGMTDDDMNNWHAQFERHNPRAHHDFLVSLGIAETEISEIRNMARD
jgi:DNA-binding transcriptional MerR regulator